MIVYDMIRGGQRKAQVATMDSGKCIISWPTSVIVYDSEAAARAVHIEHMGGRGEKTAFVLRWTDDAAFQRGWDESVLDDCDNCSQRGDVAVPEYIPTDDRPGWLAGYQAYMSV